MNKKKKMHTKKAADVLFLRDIPTNVKSMFKAYCARRGLSMKGVLMAHMRECIQQDQDLTKKA